ncbi:MAG: Fic family protein [Crocinitomicaceae bacterium]|jgi:Fic family protein
MNQFQAGKYISQGYYASFQPEKINRTWLVNDLELMNMLSKADRYIGRLDMYSHYVNIDLFIQMHIAKEATLSSKIEGTQTNVEESFLREAEVACEKRNDWEEVQNYIKAMNQAVEMLKQLPFSSRLIRKTHKTLLTGVRGATKQPGEFRKSQNWIGGATLNDAIFIPPVHTTIGSLMSDLERFANDEFNHLPDLLKIGIIHYQFETIHPFLDGNGRVGRLLITLYLVNKNILKQPVLYLSDFFEKHRMLYYDNLMRVRLKNDLVQWLKFFLTGIIETAQKGVSTLDAILQLKNEVETEIKSLKGRSDDALIVLNFLYTHPVIDVAKVEELIGKSNVTSYKLLADLEKLEILEEITNSQRNRIFAFRKYIYLFDD